MSSNARTNKRSSALALALLTVAACAAAPGDLRGQSSPFTIGGYVKNVISVVPGAGELEGFDDALYGRVNTAWFPSAAFTAALDVRAWGINLAQHTRSADAEIDRLWIDYTAGPFQCTAGRQRVAWGTNLVWNVIDLFNPYDILDFEYEERPGVDGVRARWYAGALTNAEVVVKPARTLRGGLYAMRLSGNAQGYDVHIVGALDAGRWVGGVAWAGDALGAGFRGEATVSEVTADIARAALLDSSYPRTAFATAVSADYTFPSSLYVHAEAMYNSLGRTSDISAFRPSALVLKLSSPARWSTFVEIALQVSPLVRASCFSIINPIDGSCVISPNLFWSAATNLDISLFGLFASGSPGAEVNVYGGAGYARVKWSF